MNRTKRIAARRTANFQVESLEGRQLLVAGPTIQISAAAQNLLARQRGFVLERFAPPAQAAGATGQISAAAQNQLARQRGYELERLAPRTPVAGPTNQLTAAAQNLLARQRGYELERLRPPGR